MPLTQYISISYDLSFLSKNPVNLSNFIDIFRNSACSRFTDSRGSNPSGERGSNPSGERGSNPSGERGFAFSRAWRTIPESGISWGTANAGSNPTEEGGFADRPEEGGFADRRGRVCLPKREGLPTEEGGFAYRGGRVRRPRREGLPTEMREFTASVNSAFKNPAPIIHARGVSFIFSPSATRMPASIPTE